MRHQLPQHGTEFLPHDLGQIRKDSIGKFVQIRRIQRQSLARAFHGIGKVGPERFPPHRNRHVSHALQGPSAQCIHAFLGQSHQFRHERRHPTHVRCEFLLGRDGRGRQRRHGHLLHGTLGGRLEHAGQFTHQRIEEGTHALGFQTFAKHLEDVTAGRLHGDGGIVQQRKDDGKDLTAVTQNLRLAVLADLTQREARALPDLRVGVPRRAEYVGHDVVQMFPQGFGAPLGHHPQARNARLAMIGMGRAEPRNASTHHRLEDVSFGQFAREHIEGALGHGRLRGRIEIQVVRIVIGIPSGGGGGRLLLGHILLPRGIALEQGPRGALGTALHQVEQRFQHLGQQRFVLTERLWFGLGGGGNDQRGAVPGSHIQIGIADARQAVPYHRGEMDAHRGTGTVGEIVQHVQYSGDRILVAPLAARFGHGNDGRDQGGETFHLRFVGQIGQESAQRLDGRVLDLGFGVVQGTGE
mmetsp:Transcript_28538/g.83993  ORF Transcript_28538/g.83993 Transcript_28538/m.83993 type:complete len:468 (-) Transcript_28538:188-1591(-)